MRPHLIKTWSLFYHYRANHAAYIFDFIFIVLISDHIITMVMVGRTSPILNSGTEQRNNDRCIFSHPLHLFFTVCIVCRGRSLGSWRSPNSPPTRSWRWLSSCWNASPPSTSTLRPSGQKIPWHCQHNKCCSWVSFSQFHNRTKI